MHVTQFQTLAGGKADIRSNADGTLEAVIFGGDRNISATTIHFNTSGEATHVHIPNSRMSGGIDIRPEEGVLQTLAGMAGQPAAWALAKVASTGGQNSFSVDDMRGAAFSTKTIEGAGNAVDKMQAVLAERAGQIHVHERAKFGIGTGP